MNELMTAPTTDEIIRNPQYHQAQRVVELRMTYHPFLEEILPKQVDISVG